MQPGPPYQPGAPGYPVGPPPSQPVGPAGYPQPGFPPQPGPPPAGFPPQPGPPPAGFPPPGASAQRSANRRLVLITLLAVLVVVGGGVVAQLAANSARLAALGPAGQYLALPNCNQFGEGEFQFTSPLTVIDSNSSQLTGSCRTMQDNGTNSTNLPSIEIDVDVFLGPGGINTATRYVGFAVAEPGGKSLPDSRLGSTAAIVPDKFGCTISFAKSNMYLSAEWILPDGSPTPSPAACQQQLLPYAARYYASLG